MCVCVYVCVRARACVYVGMQCASNLLSCLSGGVSLCSYEGCKRAIHHARDSYHILAATRAGGKNWGPLVGQTLCKACYTCFSRSGSLERRDRYKKPRRAAPDPGGVDAGPSDDAPRPQRAAALASSASAASAASLIQPQALNPHAANLRPSSCLPPAESWSDSDSEDSAAAEDDSAKSQCPRPDVLQASKLVGTCA
jgi:hypothetical protein